NLLLVTAQRSSPNSLHQLISCGVYPQRQKILVVKGAIAPRAAYEPIAGRIIEVDSPGSTAVNPARFTYKLVRRPLFGVAVGAVFGDIINKVLITSFPRKRESSSVETLDSRFRGNDG